MESSSQAEGREWSGGDGSGVEWRGGKGRGGQGKAGQGRVPDCLGGLSRVGISSRSTRPWNGQPPSIIKISPPSGLLTRSHNRHHYIVPRSRLNTVVYSFYPRAIRIWNTIPKVITDNYKTRIISSSHKQTPFHHPSSSKMLVTKPHFRHDGVDVVTSVTCQLAMSHHIQA